MGKCEVLRMIDQGKCVICKKQLTPEEKSQCLCSDCYDLRRVIRRKYKHDNGYNK